MTKYEIYNLEFPEHIDCFEIAKYKFQKVQEYPVRLHKLSHYNQSGQGYRTGEHAITATMECPSKDEPSPLAWGEPKLVSDDIILLLQFFTGRDVFKVSPTPVGAILRDWRRLLNYETLQCSLPQEFNEDGGDTAFGASIERVLKRVHEKEWLDTYDGGKVLFVARQIYTRQILETSFLWSYVLWEHIFYMERRNELSKKELDETTSAEQVCYLLQKYKFTPATLIEEERLIISRAFTKSRNDIAHFGLFKSNPTANKDTIKWIELTTRLLAYVLGLQPTDALSNQKWLTDLLQATPFPAAT